MVKAFQFFTTFLKNMSEIEETFDKNWVFYRQINNMIVSIFSNH